MDIDQFTKDWQKTFDSIDDWICIINLDSTIIRSNRSAEKYFHLNVEKSIGERCCKFLHGTDHPIDGCPLPQMFKNKKRASTEVQILDHRWMLVTVDPIFKGNGDILGAVHIARDITQRIAIQNDREKLLKQLKDASTHIDTLSGLIPICSNCKKIRDDKGYWNMIESYIERHSAASFSHGMCPECLDNLYGQEDWYIDMKTKKKK